MQTLYIVPALTDIAGQCRIVARDYFEGSARDNYRKEPEQWREVGLMNSRGKLVCFAHINKACLVVPQHFLSLCG